MTTWKPTKPGVYLLNGHAVCYPEEGCTGMIYHHGDFTQTKISTTAILDLQGQLIVDGLWSLLAPDWQEGVPTLEQLKKWPWWAVECRGGSKHGEVIPNSLHCGELRLSKAFMNCFSLAGAVLNESEIERCAPIQEDMSNGHLWVSREVCQ